MNNYHFSATILGVAILLQGSTHCAENRTPDQFNLRDYALPAGPLRTKLDTLFNGDKTRSPQRLRSDSSFVDLNSWHWLIGKLSDGNGTDYIVKAAIHPANIPILYPGNPFKNISHSDTQNLSRIKKAHSVNKLIEKEHLDCIRVPNSWVYPLSGNNADLNYNTKDRDVLIIEEKITGRNPDVLHLFNDFSYRGEADKIGYNTFDQLKKIVEKEKVLDLNPDNIFIDQNGIANLIDLEDLLENERNKIAQSNFILRPLKQYKFNAFEEGSAKKALGQTGRVNDKFFIRREGRDLSDEGWYDIYVKKHTFEGTIALSTLATLTGLGIRHLWYQSHVQQLFKKCETELMRSINDGSLKRNPADYVALAKQIIRYHKPSETRDEIFNAFATILYAEKNKTEFSFQVFGQTYLSSNEAIKCSKAAIIDTWNADWSIRSKIMRKIKAISTAGCNLGKKAIGYFSSNPKEDPMPETTVL